MKHFVILLLLLCASLVLGTLANTLGPHRIPWSQDWSQQVQVEVEEAGFPSVSAAEALAISNEGGRMILDARPREDYDAGHLPGALSLPVDAFEEFFPEVQGLIFPEDPLLVYCSGVSCDDALLLAKKLQELGFDSITVFVEGMEAWKAAGYPIE